ncbi:MAG: glycosyltransferase family 4 protein [Bacteroidetes bacterium]|nr:glycosyltransferase family 4 protein [Bacteroidota bacterium]
MKNILLLSPAYPYRGGIADSTHRLATELLQNGYEVDIFTFRLQYPSILFPGKSQYSESPAPEGLNIERWIHSLNPFNWLSIGQKIKRKRPDLIIVRYWLPFLSPCLGTICRLAKKNQHTKVIAITDNILPHENRPGDKVLTNYFVKSVDGFIVMSKAVGDQIRLFTKKKPISFVPHPIYDNFGELVEKELAREELGLKKGGRYILFFGFIRAYKGLDLLLKAMGDPRIGKMGVKLIVAGEFYEDAANYEKIIDEENISSQVILRTEFIPTEEVNNYFGAADLVVQPYKSATQSGISQLAYHFDKPMVVTNVGGLPEIVTHGKSGYVVDVKISSIAEAIVDYFENKREAKMVEGVREEKKRFSWENMVTGIRKLNKDVRSE